MNKVQYLGRIEQVLRYSVRGPHVQLCPLYSLASDESQWVRVEDPAMEFPNRGFVTWFNPPMEATEGSIWQFYTVTQQSYDRNNPNHDEYEVLHTPAQPREVLDLRGDGGEDAVRILLTQDGLLLPFHPMRTLYLWVEDEVWIGPLELKASGADRAWRLESDVCERPLPLVEGAPEALGEVNISGRRWFILPWARSLRVVGQVDWAPDDIIIRRVLNRLRSLDRGFTDSLHLTSRAIDHLVDQLDANESATQGASLDRRRLARAINALHPLQERQELVERFANDILHIPAVTALIDDERSRARSEAKAQFDVENASVRAQREELLHQAEVAKQQAEIAKQQAITELQRLQKEITERHTLLQAQIDSLDADLEQRLQDIMKRPSSVLADVAIIRAALGSTSTVPVAPILAEVRPWVHTISDEVRTVETFSSFRRQVRSRFQSQHLPPTAARTLDSAFRSGLMPVLVGSGAFAALQEYASCLTGNNWLWVPITPGMVEPGDLLGHVDSRGGRLIPHPSGLLDLLIYAAQSDETFLVVFDGIDLSAVEAYLSPILAVYADGHNGGSRKLPLFHPCSVGANDPYAKAAYVGWPPNVFLAGILHGGAASIRIASGFWDSATFVDLTQVARVTDVVPSTATTESAETEHETSVHVTKVRFATWQSWRIDAPKEPTEHCMELLTHLRDTGYPVTVQQEQLCLRFFNACMQWGASEDTALDDVLASLLAIQASSLGRAEELSSSLGNFRKVSERVEASIIAATSALI